MKETASCFLHGDYDPALGFCPHPAHKREVSVSARDLAATERMSDRGKRGIEVTHRQAMDTRPTQTDSWLNAYREDVGNLLAEVAALVKQAADAQAALDTWIDRYDGARAEADGWHASSDATLARAVRAEEALRRNENDWAFIFNLAPGLLADLDERVLHALAEANLRVIREALAAAGADTAQPEPWEADECRCPSGMHTCGRDTA